jgi:Arc/MetJ-type ribon-helix-helix transcriptional regulator
MSDRPRHPIELSEAQAAFVEAQVASGYGSAETVIADALARLQAQAGAVAPEASAAYRAWDAECDETDRRITAGAEQARSVAEVRTAFEAKCEALRTAGRPTAAE